MDDELQQLEAELKALRPAAPSGLLTARIERELAAPDDTATGRAPRGAVRWLWAAALPAAAAVALMVGQYSRRTARTTGLESGTPASAVAGDTEAPFKPISAENVLYSASDEGLITLADGTTARRERLQYVDTITWKNPRTNASLRWSVPREEVRVVPLVLQ